MNTEAISEVEHNLRDYWLGELENKIGALSCGIKHEPVPPESSF